MRTHYKFVYIWQMHVPWVARRTIICLTVAALRIRTVASYNRWRGTVSVTTSSWTIFFRRVLSRCTAVPAYMTPAILKRNISLGEYSGFHLTLRDGFLNFDTILVSLAEARYEVYSVQTILRNLSLSLRDLTCWNLTTFAFDHRQTTRYSRHHHLNLTNVWCV